MSDFLHLRPNMDYLALTPEVIQAIGRSDADEFVASQPWLTEREIVLHGLTLISCGHCLDLGWVCELHPTEPWAGIVGDVLGCEPDCIGPGMLCVDQHQHTESD